MTDQPHKPIRVGNIAAIAGVKTEVGKLYRAARRAAGAKMSPQDALRLAQILSIIRACIETDQLMVRVTDGMKQIEAIKAGKAVKSSLASVTPIRAASDRPSDGDASKVIDFQGMKSCLQELGSTGAPR
jgi:hypothetical protein